MKKHLFILISFVNLSGLLFSQVDTFDLSDFKLPDIKRNQLDLNLDMGFGTYIYKKKRDNDTAESNYRSFSDNSFLKYNYYINTQRYQGDQSFFVSLRPDLERQKNNDIVTSGSRYDPYASVFSANRFYIKSLFFLEADLNVSEQMYYLKQNRKEDDYTGQSRQSYFHLTIPLSAGYGRIEPVQDARLAIYILEELQKTGKLAAVPDKKEIHEIASFIATLKNERFFDYRLRRMEEIEKVDSFMQSRGWINSPDAGYYSILFDNWEYADGPFREAGRRISVGLSPFYSRNDFFEKNEDDNTTQIHTRNNSTENGVGIFIRYINEKPVNLYWQRGWTAGAEYSVAKNHRTLKNEIESTESRVNWSTFVMSGDVGYNIGYFPNSRTYAKTRFSANVDHYKFKDSDDAETKSRFRINPSLYLDLYYYLSERAGITINYNASYYFNKSEYEIAANDFYSNQFSQSFNIKFVLQIL